MNFNTLNKNGRELLKWLIAEFFNYKCLYCGYSIVDNRRLINLQLDHFIPKDMCRTPDLKNEPRNLIAACHECNKIKHNRFFNTLHSALEHVRTTRIKKGQKLYAPEIKHYNMPDMPDSLHAQETVAKILLRQMPDYTLLEYSQYCERLELRPGERPCISCGRPITDKKRQFCSIRCFEKQRLLIPILQTELS